MTDIDVVIEASTLGAVEYLTTITTSRIMVGTHFAGTRPYLAGRIRVDDYRQLDPIARFFHRRTEWAVINGTYVRVQGYETAVLLGYGYLVVDQSARADVVVEGGGYQSFRVVEPSPPAPVRDWWPTELERAHHDDDAFRHMATTIDTILAHPGIDGGAPA